MTAPPASLRPPPSPPTGPTRGGDGRIPPAESGAQVQPWTRRHPGRVRAIGFAVSALLHLIVLFLYPEIAVRFGEVDATADPTAPVDLRGFEVVNLRELVPDDVGAPRRPEDALSPEAELERVPVVPLPGETITTTPPAAPASAAATAAERLRPSTRDRRLWQPLVPEAVTLTEQEMLENLLYGQLQAFNDSMAIRAAEAARGTDWTFTDDEGNRWGISPGKLHLGKITVPLPSFGTPAGASDDVLDRLSIDAEIRRAAGQFDADATVEERAAAIRARVDAERARRAAVPDSTRRGGGGGG